jgi:hypothetical protein
MSGLRSCKFPGCIQCNQRSSQRGHLQMDMAVFVNSCARIFPEFLTCAKTCAKLAPTRHTTRCSKTHKSLVPRLLANLRQTCAKFAPDLRRRARGAHRGSLTAPWNFGKTSESRDEGVLRTPPHLKQKQWPHTQVEYARSLNRASGRFRGPTPVGAP